MLSGQILKWPDYLSGHFKSIDGWTICPVIYAGMEKNLEFQVLNILNISSFKYLNISSTRLKALVSFTNFIANRI